MTEQELINILKDMYANAQNGEKVSSIHLFGIEYAEDLINKDIRKIAIEATGNESYQTEIAKGKKLASLLKNKQLLKTNSSKVIFENSKLKTKNIMLYGAPGVGKTHNYKRLITMIENGNDEKTIFDTISRNETTNDFDNSVFEDIKKEKRIEFVTFHQSYSYEDFIEGFRPNEDGNIELDKKGGIFKRISDKAKENFEESKKETLELKKKLHFSKS